MTTTTLTEEQIISKIKNIIDKYTCLKEEKDGTYSGEIYADYRDDLEMHTIKKIFAENNPRETFEDMVSDWFMDTEFDYKDEVIKDIENHWNDDELDYSEYEDFIQDWVNENVYYNYPYKHFLNQSVYVDIILNTGDGNYDFTRNELLGCNYSEKGFKENSSLVWLMRQQGYKDEQIIEMINNDNCQDSRLLESVYQECANTSTCMNALSFFVRMTLEECFDLNEKVGETNAIYTGKHEPEDKRIGTLTLSKDTPCGLYDPWNGAGSVLDIKLEKNVEIPLKFIDSALPDGCRGYAVDDIYGMLKRFCKEDCVKNIA